MLSLILAVHLAAGAGQAAEPLLAPVDSPLWLQTPPQAQLDRLIRGVRSDLLHAGKPIEAVIECRVRTDGLLEDCKVASETPSRSGLGRGALRLMPRFRLVGQLPDGTLLSGGGTVRIPLRVTRRPLR